MKAIEKYIGLILFAAILYATGFSAAVTTTLYPEKTTAHASIPDREDGFYAAGTFHLDCLLVKQNPVPTRAPQAELKIKISFQPGNLYIRNIEHTGYQQIELSHTRQLSYLQSNGHYIYALRKIII